MCGIAVGFDDENAVELMIQLLQHRGPDAQQMVSLPSGALLGHTRLSILDTSKRSNQPFKYGHVWMAYNGECWNYKALRKRFSAKFATTGDTEVVAAMLDRYGVEALGMLDGMFALAWVDDRLPGVYLARDRFGEIPLYLAMQKPFFAASEMKALLGTGKVGAKAIRSMEPGHWCNVQRDGIKSTGQFGADATPESTDTMHSAATVLQRQIIAAVQRRSISDVKVCTMLSGGLDSSLITGVLTELWGPQHVTAYTGVHDLNSTDLRCARKMAIELGITLREVAVPTPTLEQLKEVVRIVETPLKVQVEIGWACYCLAKAMQQDGFKVVYSGEGSDELWASYGFAWAGLQKKGWHRYRRELYASLERKNYPRNNKIFMSHGIECRQPFADKDLVPYALSLSAATVRGTAGASCSKKVLALAAMDHVPGYITSRQKIAFQVGLGLSEDITAAYGDPSGQYREWFEEMYR